MKAIRIHSYGHSDQLKIEEINSPKLRSDEVVVQIRSAGVNPVDWKIREGLRKDRFPVDFPATVGQDFAGEILLAGEEVADFEVGDAVFGFVSGAYAESAAASTAEIALKPKSVDFVAAASLPTAALTAWQALIDIAKLSSGQSVLVHGAGGGVGSLACQIAKWRGARVIGTCSTDDIEYLRSLKIDQLIDYKREDFSQQVRNVDVVLDLIGGSTQEKSLGVLKLGGFIVTTVGGLDAGVLRERGLRGQAMVMSRDGQGLKEIARLVDAGALKSRVSQVMKLEEAARAQDLMQNGHPHGKVVLQV